MRWRVLFVPLLLAPVKGLAAPPGLQPTSVPYRVSQPAATGRSGSASIQARVLLAQDGSSLLEVTTGTLDSAAPAPGELAKVQLEGFTAAGKSAFVVNENGLSSPTFSQGFTRFVHLQPFQVQANVRGIDGARTDVVTVSDVVRERPDLEVASVTAPAQAPVNAPVNVTAVVREKNGDVGAHADCLLEVDGTVADEVPGIWIDAGGSVSCAFTQVFAESGAHTLTVRAANVVPGDWDDTNNAASAEIQIVQPTVPLSDWALAEDLTTAYDAYSTGWYQQDSGDPTGEDWDQHSGYVQRRQAGTLFAYGPVELRFPLQLAELSQETGGTMVDARELTGVEATSTSGTESNHTSVWTDVDSAAGVFIQVSSSGGTQSAANTTVYYNRYSGDVVYLSFGQLTYWWSDGSSTGYVYNQVGPEVTSGPPFVTMGPDYQLHARLIGADGQGVSADADVPLAPRDTFYASPERCSDVVRTGYSSHACTGYVSATDGVYGIVTSP